MDTILALVGINDSNQIAIQTTKFSGKEQLVYRLENDVSAIAGLNPKRYRIMTLLIGGERSQFGAIPKPDLIYNGISDPDSFSRALDEVELNIGRLNVPFVNPPSQTRKTCNDGFWQLFRNRKDVIVPKAIRISPRRRKDIEDVIQSGEMGFPFIFSAANRQEDNTRLLVQSIEQMSALERFAFDGRDYYMREFIDFRSADGFYRRYRFFVIGGKVYPGFLMIANHWYIHSEDQANSTFDDVPKPLDVEKKAFLRIFGKKKFPAFEEIYQMLELDYFGIDCGFDDADRPIIFGLGGGKHHRSMVKNPAYYSAKDTKQLDQAVERMVFKKLKASRIDNG